MSSPKPLYASIKPGWTPKQLGDQSGKTFLITGGNSGIGLEAAKILAGKGGDILLCARNETKGRKAVDTVNAIGGGQATMVKLDLADMSSIHAAAKTVQSKTDKIDALINNAGIMQTPKQTTADGFEMQLGTNHLGHFLLNGLLFPLVEAAKGRIVVVSSIAHKFGRLNLGDLMYENGGYSPTTAYGQSKLANIMYAFELQRRLSASDSSVTAYAVHPGYSSTHLQSTGPTGLLNLIYKPMNLFIAQPAKYGAYPSVLAATDPNVQPGGYYGPTGWMDARGPVGDAAVHPKALREDKAANLWVQSEAFVDFYWDSVLTSDATDAK
jgi:NAD(P)-dependent dehydrogenase (short-subunit alcohol dehydrogenase family)